VIAACFLYIIKITILHKDDMRSAAKKIVPILVAIMTAAFVTYVTLKGLKHVWGSITSMLSFLPQTKKPPLSIAALFGLLGGILSCVLLRPSIAARSRGWKIPVTQ
jgi:PiT family inorganic phosphate transporter